ncbi:hypothetical protein M569_10892, partial [Genlisea aurea]
MPTITKIYSMLEASQHNTRGDCWIVVEGKVYDVSSYLDEHPGGDDVLLRATGKDATEEFEDAGHSKTARELMEKFFIGELDDETPPPIPELQILHKKNHQSFQNLPTKIINFSKQSYWFLPASVLGLSVLVA